jgi:hypothetical protein
MNYESVVHNGQVVLHVGDALPEGTAVRVTVSPAEPKPPAEPPADEPTLKSLLRLSGAVKGMPSDFAEQHDHYLHGTPKR